MDGLLAKGWEFYEKRIMRKPWRLFTKVSANGTGRAADGYYGRGMTRSAQGRIAGAIEDFSESNPIEIRERVGRTATAGLAILFEGRFAEKC